MKTFFFGVAMIGAVLGLMVGISSTPVVGVIVPLIFAFITAGGGIYLVRGQKDATGGGPKTQAERAYFLGWQFVALAVGTLSGLYFGVLAKLHAEHIWFATTNAPPAFQYAAATNVQFLAAAMRLDDEMIEAGLDFEERKKQLAALGAYVKEAEAADAKRRQAGGAQVSGTPPQSESPTEKTKNPVFWIDALGEDWAKFLERERKPPKPPSGPVALDPKLRSNPNSPKGT